MGNYNEGQNMRHKEVIRVVFLGLGFLEFLMVERITESLPTTAGGVV